MPSGLTPAARPRSRLWGAGRTNPWALRGSFHSIPAHACAWNPLLPDPRLEPSCAPGCVETARLGAGRNAAESSQGFQSIPEVLGGV